MIHGTEKFIQWPLKMWSWLEMHDLKNRGRAMDASRGLPLRVEFPDLTRKQAIRLLAMCDDHGLRHWTHPSPAIQDHYTVQVQTETR